MKKLLLSAMLMGSAFAANAQEITFAMEPSYPPFETTNEKGEIIIDGILPGKYFIEEVSTKQGYIKLNNKVEFDIDLNEEVEVTITNEKGEKPKKEKKESKKEKTYTEKNYKLPVTGM